MQNPEPETQPRDAFSTQEFADRLGIGYQSALRLQKNGTVRLGRRVLIPRTELDRLLAPPELETAA
jgi:excisionase family DNA binding protein